MIDHLCEVHLCSLKFHTDLLSFRRNDRVAKICQVIFRISPFQFQRHQFPVHFFVTYFISTFFKFFTLFIECPAAINEFLFCLIDVVCIMCQFPFQLVLCLLVVFHRFCSKAVYNACVSAGNLLVHFITVNNVSKSTAYFRELACSEITCETELVYTVLRYNTVVGFDLSVFYFCQSGVDGLTLGRIEVIYRSFFKLISPCFGSDRFRNDRLNMRFGSIISTQILFVDLKFHRLGSNIHIL